ncbi:MULTISPECIES: hypothetical protein [unclassified Nocardioides]|uniref:hypothetical protein n=1 Tax=unclassified Nocardioides TaxID=2615069 RepID=UPI0011545A29|nr:MULTISPECIES: hypothetical protein [unclassified Nocardioides]TQK71031.1 hypothetical protein FBY23_2817 [Nocardioides sp. SLBN-35]WGX99583.1 hypothetical protein QI633_13650 [Nocardioides sp. QY071]
MAAFQLDPVTGLSLGRIAIGVGALAAPSTTARVLGLDPAANPQLDYMGRMFGAREIALGAVTLVSRGALRRNLTAVGIAVDGADLANGVIELGQKNVSKLASGMLIGAAAGAVGSGVLALVRGRGRAKAA